MTDWLHVKLSSMFRSSARGDTNPTGGYQRVWVFSSTTDYIMTYILYKGNGPFVFGIARGPISVGLGSLYDYNDPRVGDLEGRIAVVIQRSEGGDLELEARIVV